MSLKNGLEVEGERVPEREFAARRSRQDSPCIRRELFLEDTMVLLQYEDFRTALVCEGLTRTRLIGHRTLLVEVWTYLVRIEVEGVLRLACGGKNFLVVIERSVLEWTLHSNKNLKSIEQTSTRWSTHGLINRCSSAQVLNERI